MILGIDLLASYYASINYFGNRVTFHILGQHEFNFEGKHVVGPLCMILALWVSFLPRKGCRGFLAYVVCDRKDGTSYYCQVGKGLMEQ